MTTTSRGKPIRGAERLLRKTSLGATYVSTDFDGTNRSGVQPIGDTVLVMCDKPVTKTPGGIELPDTVQAEHKAAAETGVVVALADGAFLWTQDRLQAFKGRKPVPGDRVYFTRYAGQLVVGKDGLEYRVMTDNCIGALEVDAPAA